MGLDMYLTAEKYLSNWDPADAESKASFAKVIEAAGFDIEDVPPGSPGVTIEANVMYWRKANAIHNWFVQRVQNGTDDCGRYRVTRDHLTLLKEACEEVIDNPNATHEVLPTKSGFFFGGTLYDERYWNELEETAVRIGKILNDPKYQKCTFYYQSSW